METCVRNAGESDVVQRHLANPRRLTGPGSIVTLSSLRRVATSALPALLPAQLRLPPDARRQVTARHRSNRRARLRRSVLPAPPSSPARSRHRRRQLHVRQRYSADQHAHDERTHYRCRSDVMVTSFPLNTAVRRLPAPLLALSMSEHSYDTLYEDRNAASVMVAQW